jgi:hypothetical protein
MERVILQINNVTRIANAIDVARAEDIYHTTSDERVGLKGFDAHGNTDSTVWQPLDDDDFLFCQRAYRCIIVVAFGTASYNPRKDLRRLRKIEASYKDLLARHLNLIQEKQMLDKQFKDMSVAFVGIRDSFVDAQREKCELQLKFAEFRRK